MDNVLAITLQGLQLDTLRLERIASNLANVQTTGYRRDLLVMTPFAQRIDGTSPSTIASDSQIDRRPGPLKATGQPLDLAIGGDGWFEVLTPQGPAYTRKGDLHVDARGLLVSAEGHAVMGLAGEIRLPGPAPFIDALGRIFDRGSPEGGGQPAGPPLAQLRIVRFEGESGLRRLGDGLLSPGSDANAIAATPALRQGYLEGSNVNAVQEMVQLMQTMRHAESLQKAAMGYDEMLGNAIRKLGEAP